MLHHTDTIAAVSTPAGSAARAITRLSGDDAVDIAQKIVDPPVRLAETGPWSSRRISIRLLEGRIHLPATLYLMPAPRSYTRQDIVELHTVGSPVILQMLLDELLQLGARMAGPGEFTRRAFLNGRIDLAQAEAVMAIIQARNDADLRVAVGQLTSSSSDRLADLRDHLIGLRAYVETAIDFSDQDIELISSEEIASSLAEARTMIAGLIGSGERAGSGKAGVITAIVGLPNAGKSSLFNRLAGGDRAIVTHIPGTTRDTVEATIEVAGTAFRLIDTAGVEAAQDAIQHCAVERTRETLNSAQLLLYVIDGNAGTSEADRKLWATRPPVPGIVVVNKADLPQSAAPEAIAFRFSADRVIAASATEGIGIDELLAAMADAVASGEVDVSAHPFAANVRLREALRRTDKRLLAAFELASHNAGEELIAIEIRDALDNIGRLTGDVADDDLLDAIFSRFCIGK